jgi:hypothetical protein
MIFGKLAMNEELKWYTTDQNNSGGYWIENEDVAHYVSVQAKNVAEAKEKFEHITAGYSQYCECCGERWSYDYLEESDGHKVPSYYNQPLNELKNVWNDTHVVFYFADGTRRYGKFTKNVLIEVDCAGKNSTEKNPTNDNNMVDFARVLNFIA